MGTLFPLRIKGALLLAILPALVTLACTSCTGDESQPNYGEIIEGTYSGTVTTGAANVSGITEVVRFTDTKVDLHITAGSHTLDIPGVRITSYGDDIYYLSYSIVGNTLDGNIDGDQLTYTLTSGALNGTFNGTRQH
jgi:hypothetical protein